MMNKKTFLLIFINLILSLLITFLLYLFKPNIFDPYNTILTVLVFLSLLELLFYKYNLIEKINNRKIHTSDLTLLKESKIEIKSILPLLFYGILIGAFAGFIFYTFANNDLLSLQDALRNGATIGITCILIILSVILF